MKGYSDTPLRWSGERDGWVTNEIGISWPSPLPKPRINAKHIDGPVLFFSDGQMHWLTVVERVMVRLGIHNAESLQVKHRPNLTKWLTNPGPNPYNQRRSNPPPVMTGQQEKGHGNEHQG